LADEERLVSVLYTKYSPLGLKSIEFRPSEKDVAVLVSASAKEIIASVNSNPSKSDDYDRIIKHMRRFAGFKPFTVIDTTYNGVLIDQVKNSDGHAETVYTKKARKRSRMQ
jgi:hypothetical protein